MGLRWLEFLCWVQRWWGSPMGFLESPLVLPWLERPMDFLG